MDCPKCGYAMTDFDVECPRCKRLGQQAPQAAGPTPGTGTPPATTMQQPPEQTSAGLQGVPVPEQSATQLGAPPSAAEQQAKQKAGTCVAVVLVAIGVLTYYGCNRLFTPRPDPYTAAEYNAWLQPIAAELHGVPNSSIAWRGTPGRAILITVAGPVSKRQASDTATIIANSYLTRFPKSQSIFVKVEEYHSMETLHSDYYYLK